MIRTQKTERHVDLDSITTIEASTNSAILKRRLEEVGFRAEVVRSDTIADKGLRGNDNCFLGKLGIHILTCANSMHGLAPGPYMTCGLSIHVSATGPYMDFVLASRATPALL